MASCGTASTSAAWSSQTVVSLAARHFPAIHARADGVRRLPFVGRRDRGRRFLCVRRAIESGAAGRVQCLAGCAGKGLCVSRAQPRQQCKPRVLMRESGGSTVPGGCPHQAATAIRAGVNLNCGGFYRRWLPSAVAAGLVSHSELDTAFVTLWRTAFHLGMCAHALSRWQAWWQSYNPIAALAQRCPTCPV